MYTLRSRVRRDALPKHNPKLIERHMSLSKRFNATGLNLNLDVDEWVREHLAGPVLTYVRVKIPVREEEDAPVDVGLSSDGDEVGVAGEWPDDSQRKVWRLTAAQSFPFQPPTPPGLPKAVTAATPEEESEHHDEVDVYVCDSDEPSERTSSQPAHYAHYYDQEMLQAEPESLPEGEGDHYQKTVDESYNQVLYQGKPAIAIGDQSLPEGMTMKVILSRPKLPKIPLGDGSNPLIRVPTPFPQRMNEVVPEYQYYYQPEPQQKPVVRPYPVASPPKHPGVVPHPQPGSQPQQNEPYPSLLTLNAPTTSKFSSSTKTQTLPHQQQQSHSGHVTPSVLPTSILPAQGHFKLAPPEYFEDTINPNYPPQANPRAKRHHHHRHHSHHKYQERGRFIHDVGVAPQIPLSFPQEVPVQMLKEETQVEAMIPAQIGNAQLQNEPKLPRGYQMVLVPPEMQPYHVPAYIQQPKQVYLLNLPKAKQTPEPIQEVVIQSPLRKPYAAFQAQQHQALKRNLLPLAPPPVNSFLAQVPSFSTVKPDYEYEYAYAYEPQYPASAIPPLQSAHKREAASEPVPTVPSSSPKLPTPRPTLPLPSVVSTTLRPTKAPTPTSSDVPTTKLLLSMPTTLPSPTTTTTPPPLTSTQLLLPVSKLLPPSSHLLPRPMQTPPSQFPAVATLLPTPNVIPTKHLHVLLHPMPLQRPIKISKWTQKPYQMSTTVLTQAPVANPASNPVKIIKYLPKTPITAMPLLKVSKKLSQQPKGPQPVQNSIILPQPHKINNTPTPLLPQKEHEVTQHQEVTTEAQTAVALTDDGKQKVLRLEFEAKVNASDLVNGTVLGVSKKSIARQCVVL